jgi:antitoxin component YwqK of YwqJK toxin-antitoxin module
LRDGIWREYNKNGILISDEEYKDGEIIRKIK